MSNWPFKTECIREGCGHSTNDHRLDDALNLSPTDPAAPFRCVVPGCGCPDTIRSAENLAALRG